MSIAVAADHDRFAHTALVYGSDEEYLAGALPFLEQGRDAGEACIVLADPATEVLLRAHLPRGASNVQFGDPASWYTSSPGAMLGALDDCFAEHSHEGVRILGGVRWDGLGHLELRAWQRYEAALNAAFAGRHAALLCAYDTSSLDESIVAAARCTHPAINEAGADRHSLDYLDAAQFCSVYDSEQLPAPTSSVDSMRFDVTTLAATRTFTAAHAASVGLDDQRVSDVVLAVGEVTANVVRHAVGHGMIACWREDRHLVFDVIDEGESVAAPLAGWVPPKPGSTHGMGLWLARQLVDLVELRNDHGWQVRLYADVR